MATIDVGGPVLLNYGIDEARAHVERQRNPALVGPVYPGMTCHPGPDPGQVRFTVKASPLMRDYEASSRSFGKKVDQEKRDENDVAKGKVCPGPRPGVKSLVDVFGETGETVAIATILTMVKKVDQN